MTAIDRATHIDFLLNLQTTMKGNVVRESINKSDVKGAKYQTVKGSGILYSSITKPAMDKHKHKTEKKLIILSRLSGIVFLNTKAEIAPIKTKAMIIISIRLRKGVRDLCSNLSIHQLLPAHTSGSGLTRRFSGRHPTALAANEGPADSGPLQGLIG